MKSNRKIMLIAGIGFFSLSVTVLGMLYSNDKIESFHSEGKSVSLNSTIAEKNVQPTSVPKLQINFSEVKHTEEGLIALSNLVVKGEFINIKKRDVSPVKNKKANKEDPAGEVPGNGEVAVPYIVYEFKVSENLSDESKKLNKINVVTVDMDAGLGSPDALNKKGECVLFLHKNDNDTYSLVSYSQGFREVKENGTDLECTISKEKSTLSELRAKIGKN